MYLTTQPSEADGDQRWWCWAALAVLIGVAIVVAMDALDRPQSAPDPVPVGTPRCEDPGHVISPDGMSCIPPTPTSTPTPTATPAPTNLTIGRTIFEMWLVLSGSPKPTAG